MRREPRLTAVPAARSRMPLLQIRVAVILGSLVAAALLGLVSTVAWIANKPQPADLGPVTTYGRGLAEVAANSWLDGTPLAVATLNNVTLKTGSALVHGPIAWDGFSRSSLPAPSGLVYERHRFVTTIAGLDDKGKQTWRPVMLTVTVAFPTSSSPVLASLPSLESVTTAGSGKVFDYTDLSDKQLPSGASAQLQSWVQYWVTDNRAQLKQLTGDGQPGAVYVGLGGFANGELSVVSSLPAGATQYGQDTWLVRARVRLIGANEYSQEMEMDLTVIDASSGLPRVIGWGPAGVGLRGPNETRAAS